MGVNTAFLAVHPHAETGCDRIADELERESYEADDVYYALETELGGGAEERDPVTTFAGEKVDNVKGGLKEEKARELTETYDQIRVGGAFFDECVRHTVKTLYEAATANENPVTVNVLPDATIWQSWDHTHVFSELYDHPKKRQKALELVGGYADLFEDGYEEWKRMHTDHYLNQVKETAPNEMNEELSTFLQPFIGDEHFSLAFD